jgi:hypothetical protein
MSAILRSYKAHRRRWQSIVYPASAAALFVVSILVMIDLSEFFIPRARYVRWNARNFFGVLNVQERDHEDPAWRRYILVHGTTTHGSQYTSESRRREPTTYFSPISGVARAFEYFHRHVPPGQFRIGAVGLGVGTIAAYAEKGDALTFYEINPAVIDVTVPGHWFTYIRDCRERGANCDVRLGDARLSLRHELTAKTAGDANAQTPPPYHLIVLDAFSGDSVPVHLLTRQAFEIYLARLTGDKDAAGKPEQAGAIAVHISNQYLNLEPVVRAIALHYKLLALRIVNQDNPEKDILNADWIILTHNRTMANELSQYAAPPEMRGFEVLWTDTSSSLFQVLR